MRKAAEKKRKRGGCIRRADVRNRATSTDGHRVVQEASKEKKPRKGIAVTVG
jgi:hypothetical protein